MEEVEVVLNQQEEVVEGFLQAHQEQLVELQRQPCTAGNRQHMLRIHHKQRMDQHLHRNMPHTELHNQHLHLLLGRLVSLGFELLVLVNCCSHHLHSHHDHLRTTAISQTDHRSLLGHHHTLLGHHSLLATVVVALHRLVEHHSHEQVERVP